MSGTLRGEICGLSFAATHSAMWTEVDFQHTHPKSHPMKICLNYNFFRINKTKNNGYGIKELFIKVIFPCSKGTFFSIVHYGLSG